MSKIRNHKTNFTAGEVSYDLLGRADLSAYDNGALELKNVFISPIGGIERRSGLRYVATLPDIRALTGFLTDITHGATHYHNKQVNPSWARKLTPVYEYKNHLFYREIA